MKVNLIINEDRMKEGYENVPLNDASVEGIPDSACKELMIDNVFEFIPEHLTPTILKKIRKGGILEIRSPDGEEICRQLQVGSLSFEDASSLLTGGRARMSTLARTRSLLESKGLKIEFAGINGAFYRITAKRDS
jgi:hypothetical protein